MSSPLTRRTALSVIGLSSAAFLAACSSESQQTTTTASAPSPSEPSSSTFEVQSASPRVSRTATASASATPSASPSESATATPSASPTVEEKKDFSGEAKIDKYDKPGEYMAATEEHPAQNVPIPVQPESMKKDNAAGFAGALAWFGAAVDYLLQTGDMQYVNTVTLNAEAKNVLQGYAESTKKSEADKIWYAKPSASLIITAPQPVYAGGSWNWQVKLNIDVGEKIYRKGTLQDTPADKRHIYMSGEAVGTYMNGIWDLNMDIN